MPTETAIQDPTSDKATAPEVEGAASQTQLSQLDNHITIEGMLFIFFAFAIGFAAYNTGNSLLYLIMSMMLAFLLFSGFMAFQTLRGLEASRVLPHRVFARTPTRVSLKIANRKRRLASYSLRLRDENATQGDHGLAYVLMIPPRQDRRTSYQTVFPQRGLHRFAICHIFTRYPFGFFERHLALPMPEEVLVYPQIRRFLRPPDAALIRLGERASNLRGLGDDLRALREHTPGDPARQIHWKASARSDRLIVKETEQDARERFEIILNNAVDNIENPATIETFELAVDLCASLAVYLSERGIGLTLWTRSGRLTTTGSVGELDRVFRTLALLPLLPMDQAPPMPRPPSSVEKPVQIGICEGEAKLSSAYVPASRWKGLIQSDGLDEDGTTTTLVGPFDAESGEPPSDPDMQSGKPSQMIGEAHES